MLTEKLTSIANAIREKGGTTDKLTLAQMPNAIAALSTGGSGEDGVPETINISMGAYKFYGDDLKWIREKYADRIVTNLNQNCEYMFSSATNDEDSIGFKLGMANTYINTDQMFFNANFYPKEEEVENLRYLSVANMYRNNRSNGKIPSMTFLNGHSMASDYSYLFQGCNATEIGTLTNFYPYTKMDYFFSNMPNLKNCPVFVNPDLGKLQTSNYKTFSGLAMNCYSLRDIDANLLAEYYNTAATTTTYHPFYRMFKFCACIDEINGIVPLTATLTSSMFIEAFQHTYRLKKLTFALQEDGTPYIVKWKNQTIDLSQYTGWAGAANADEYITEYNSGITAEDEDNDWSNNPNYWSRQFMNSRFNHDSAVNLINSLPDTSAYLATQTSGTNTVKFYTNAGSATPSGGVNALTEEEIAVAAAKGWTIAYGT